MLTKLIHQKKIRRDNLAIYSASILYLLVLFYVFFFHAKNYQGVEYRLWDFRAYYNAGKVVLENLGDLYSDEMIVAGFVNLPIIAYLFSPFALLNWQVAEVVFLLFSILSIFAFIYFLVKLTAVSGRQKILVFLLVFTHHPLFNSLRFGNTTQFVLLILTGSFFSLQINKEFRAGVLLALAALIKIPLAFPVIYFILRGRWMVVISFFGTCFLAGLSSLLILGVNLNLLWFERCILAFAGKVMPAYNVQSISGFLARLSTNIPIDIAESWTPIELSFNFKLAQYVIITLLIGGTIWLGYRFGYPKTLQAINLEFFVFLVLGLIISPISWTHYYLLLLLPISLWIAGRLAIPFKGICFSLMLSSIFLIGTPTLVGLPKIFGLPSIQRNWFSGLPFIGDVVFNVLVSPNLLGGIILLCIFLYARSRVVELDRSMVKNKE